MEHLVRGWLEKWVHLQLFQMAHKLPVHLVGTHKKNIYKKALNVGHWTFEHDEKEDLELGSYHACTGN